MQDAHELGKQQVVGQCGKEFTTADTESAEDAQRKTIKFSVPPLCSAVSAVVNKTFLSLNLTHYQTALAIENFLK
jgi:hypothetical protein